MQSQFCLCQLFYKKTDFFLQIILIYNSNGFTSQPAIYFLFQEQVPRKLWMQWQSDRVHKDCRGNVDKVQAALRGIAAQVKIKEPCHVSTWLNSIKIHIIPSRSINRLKWITIICQDLVLHPDKKDLVTYVTKVVSCMQWHNKSFKMFKQIFKFSRCASKSHVYYFMILQAEFKLDKGE